MSIVLLFNGDDTVRMLDAIVEFPLVGADLEAELVNGAFAVFPSLSAEASILCHSEAEISASLFPLSATIRAFTPSVMSCNAAIPPLVANMTAIVPMMMNATATFPALAADAAGGPSEVVAECSADFPLLVASMSASPASAFPYDDGEDSALNFESRRRLI